MTLPFMYDWVLVIARTKSKTMVMQIFIYLVIHFGQTSGTRGNKLRGNMGDQEVTRITRGNKW